MEIRDYARLLRRAWPLIVVLALVGALLGAAANALKSPQYESTATAYVSVPSGGSLSDLSSGAAYTQQAVASYADIATTAYVLKPVIARLRLQESSAQLASSVTATAASEAAVLEITVQDGSAQRAARIANAITAQLAEAVVSLTPTSAGSTATASVKLTPVDPAIASTKPLGAAPALFIAGGALGGLVVAVALALLVDLLDTRIRDQEDLARVTEAPLLGATLRDGDVSKRPLIVRDRPSSPRAEAYRTMRSTLRFVELDDAARSIVVTSSVEGEGKSTTAANLAIAVAGLGERVLLVDADLRRPRIATLFGIDGSIGLTDVLITEVPLRRAVQVSSVAGLDLLPAGTVPPNPNEQLQSRAMIALLAQLHEQYDLVVFDTPPLLAVSDAAVLSTRTGGAIVVTAAGRVRRGQLSLALETLERAEVRLLGVVLTMLPRRAAGGAYGAYGGYGHDDGPAGPMRPVEPFRVPDPPRQTGRGRDARSARTAARRAAAIRAEFRRTSW